MATVSGVGVHRASYVAAALIAACLLIARAAIPDVTMAAGTANCQEGPGAVNH
jgi:hypothetical protein